MHLTLVAAITMDGRLRPVPARRRSAGLTQVEQFRNGRRAAGIAKWAQRFGAADRVECEISQPAAWPVAKALFDANLVDELLLTVLPLISARGKEPTLTGPPTPEFLPAAIHLKLISVTPAGEACVLRYAAPGRDRASSHRQAA